MVPRVAFRSVVPGWNTHCPHWCMHPIIRIKLLNLDLTMRIPTRKPKAALGYSVSILSTRFHVDTKIPKKGSHASERSSNADLIRFPTTSFGDRKTTMIDEGRRLNAKESCVKVKQKNDNIYLIRFGLKVAAPDEQLNRHGL